MAKHILEVWDFRLSKGSPILYDTGEYWRVVINANDGSGVLAEHVTDVKTTGNVHDPVGIAACYDWLRSVRDKYSRDHIELRKPVAAMINMANAVAAQLTAEGKKGELADHLEMANAEIKKATAAFHALVKEGGAS